jgi:hypothetical protein
VRKSLIILCVLLLSVGLAAQQRTGNIYGKVADPEGNALPGVTVTLTGQYTAPQVQVSTAEGAFRFLSLPPAKDYALKMELSGFKTRTEGGIIVIVGGNTNLTLNMEVGVLEEQVTVTAVSPMVDAKKTSVGTNVTQEILQSLPTARDPWVVLQMAPSIIVDRENIGGAESGQQSNYIARGSDTYNNNVWAMDGIVITDPAAIGASPSYYDFDAFEEMQITVGGADVSVQTGGIALNMVTRRGGNNVTLGGRFYVIDEKFQAKNDAKVAEIQKTEKYFYGINKIKNNKDYGFNLGLPILKDRAWVWVSYGVQDIKTTTIYAQKDDTLLENYVGKINLQIIPQNRFEAFAHIGGKKKFGRSGSYENPEGLYQQGRYHFGSPILKLQDEHMFGDNLFVSLKYAYSDAGFSLTPMTDLDFNKVPIWDVTAQRYYGSQSSRYFVQRPVSQYNGLINYFNDGLLGASHDIKLGVEYAQRRQYVESVWSGNMMINRNYDSPTADFNGDGLPDVPSASVAPYFNYFSFWRGYYADQVIDAFAGYLSDTITFGRFNVLLGLRWDQQTPYLNPFKVKAMDGSGAWKALAPESVQNKLNALLPGVSFDKTTATYADGASYRWTVWSPRLGVTWDATGDGKTLLKLSLAQYGDFMGTGTADRWRRGGVGGWLDFWWWDTDKSGMMDLSELYWTHPADSSLYHAFDSAGNFAGDWNDAAGTWWGSYDYLNPLKTTEPYQSTASGSGSSRTSEVMLTLDREILADFSASLILSYRKYDKFSWTLKYFKDAAGKAIDFQNKNMYVSAGKPGASVPGIADTKEGKNNDWYYQSVRLTDYSPWTQIQSRPDYYQDYWGVDVVLNKRLSHKWMLNANFTWQDQAQHYGSNGYLDPTNLWAYDGEPQAAFIGGASGKINQYTYARWMGKIGGLYQLPFDINVSGTFNVREGWVVNEYFTIVDYRLPNAKSRSNNILMSPFGSQRLPMFYNLSLRLEKMLRLGDTGRIYVMADLFNVLNSTIENRRYQKFIGTSYIYPNSAQNRFVPYLQNYALNEIINPRVMRVGVRFTF